MEFYSNDSAYLFWDKWLQNNFTEEVIPVNVRKILSVKLASLKILNVNSLKQTIEGDPNFLRSEICRRDEDLVEDITAVLNGRSVTVRSSKSRWNPKYLAFNFLSLVWFKLEKDTLGKGSLGTVYKCIYNGQPCAIKLFDSLDTFTAKEKNTIIREARMMQLVSTHPNIIKFIGLSFEMGVMLTELAQASLYGVLHCEQSLPGITVLTSKLKLSWFLGIAKALQFLHMCDIVHGDIKPQNVLLVYDANNNTTVAKVSDFGVSVAVANIVESKSAATQSVRISMPYMAPELIVAQQSMRTFSTDIYAFGVLMNECMSGELPWNDVNQDQILAEITVGKRPNAFVPSNECEQELLQLIGDATYGCLSSDYASRPSASDLAEKLNTLHELSKHIVNESDIQNVQKEQGVVDGLAGLQKQETETNDSAHQKRQKTGEYSKTGEFFGQKSVANSLCLHPNGNILISASYDQTLRFWNLTTGYCEQVWNETDHGCSVAMLSNGYIVNNDSNGSTMYVYDNESRRCLLTLSGHTGYICVLIILKDDKIVSGSDDNTIRVWNSTTGGCLKVLSGHTGAITSLVELSNGNIASGSWDNSIRIWDLHPGSCVKVLSGHTNNVWCIALLSDGRLVSGSRDETIRIWNVDTEVCEHVLEGHTSSVSALSVLSDNRIVSGSNDKTIRIWNATTFSCEQTLDFGVSVYTLCVVNDEIVSGGGEGKIVIWS